MYQSLDFHPQRLPAATGCGGTGDTGKSCWISVPPCLRGLARQGHHDLTTTNEIHNLDAVAFVDERVGEELPLEDCKVVLDSDPARIDRQLHQQIGDRQRLVEFVGFAVERDAQGTVAARNAPAYRAVSGQSS